jgi:hypothetical protein
MQDGSEGGARSARHGMLQGPVLSKVIGMKYSLTVHSARNFTGLLVAPPDGSKISLIVHEATVEEWLHIWTGRGDVDLRKWLLTIMMVTTSCTNLATTGRVFLRSIIRKSA